MREHYEDLGSVKHEKALERATAILEQNRTDMDDFTDYGPEMIRADKEKVADREKRFASGSRNSNHELQKQRANIFEAIVFDQGCRSTWFGVKSSMILPTKFDDYINGVDGLIEIERSLGISVSALTLDVTFSLDVVKKIEHVVGKIRDGFLSTVKYYSSKLGNFRGRITNIPHFVVGSDKNTLDELTSLFADNKDRQIELHHAQFQIIELIILQSDAFADLGRIYKKKDITEAYERMGRIFRDIYEERIKVTPDTGKRDGFFLHFKKMLEQAVNAEKRVMGMR